MLNRELNYIYLTIKYPTLKGFFQSCYENNEDEKLLDFLFAIETNNVIISY